MATPRTFLELVNRARRECGVTGPALSTLSNLSGESLRIAEWVAESWNDLQTMHTGWLFMNRKFSFTTTANKQTYTPAECGVNDLSHWFLRTFRCYVTAQGRSSEQFLIYNDRLLFRDVYQFGPALTNYQRPTIFTVEEDGLNLSFGAIPDSNAYTILGEYYAKPSEMLVAADEPGDLPWEYRMILVYDAMKRYGAYESAPEVFDRGRDGYDLKLSELERTHLPIITLGEPLA